YRAVCPRRIQPWMLAKRACRDRHEKVGMRDLDAMGSLDRGQHPLARLVECGCIHLPREEEMRNGRPALRRALRHEASDRWGQTPFTARLKGLSCLITGV